MDNKKIEEGLCMPFPLTKRMLGEDMKARIARINQEFADGFSFVATESRSITIFGSARSKPEDKYYQKAEQLAGRISSELKYAVVSGGGGGIMEAANKGAKEAGGTSLGLNIKLPKEQQRNGYTTADMQFYYFFTRKVVLTYAAEAYIFYPGGFGTLNELFEIITLIQTSKIEHVPVILVGKEFWTPLDTFIKETLVDTFKTIDERDTALYTITDDEEEIMNIVRQAPARER